MSAEQIRRWKDLPMRAFESQVWKEIGFPDIKDKERCKVITIVYTLLLLARLLVFINHFHLFLF